MDESVFPSSIVLNTTSDSSFMDLDDLLLEGCWLETTDGSEFFQHSPFNPNALFEPSYLLPQLEPNNGELIEGISKESEVERKKSSLPENLSASQYQGVQCFGQNDSNAVCSSGLVESSELSRRWWIGQKATTSVMDRLIQALGYIKDFSRDKDMLIQIWVPVNRDGRRVLVTGDQPFQLDLKCPRLAHYRDISIDYEFPVEEDSQENVGLPGRVFLGKVPEWTPDVQLFKREEYPRVGHAQHYDVRGTFAVPVFEKGSRTCLGVIEVVLTTQKVKYRHELDSVCKALEEVDLRGSKISNVRNAKTCDSYQVVLPEILEVLKSACATHKLPLAQTWVPCVQQGKEGLRHSDENLLRCVSTVDSACYIADPRIQGFHEACSEHHLLKGLGVVGRAFMTNQPCFSADITSFSKTEYPLSHYARIFSLQAAVAIRLRSTCTGSTDFVLEFFLPRDCKSPEEHKRMLTSLSIIIQNVCQTLRVVTEQELEEEAASLSSKVAKHSDIRIDKEVPNLKYNSSVGPCEEGCSWTSSPTLVQESCMSASAFQNEKASELLYKRLPEFRQQLPEFVSGSGLSFDSTSGEGSAQNVGRAGDKKRMKAEKTITLQILQQYFAGSLKDAAKSLGVCPTTLKRICRQHGIKRWPSRKIKKVGHSLQKIRRVIDSVQGASGALQIETFYSNFPELASSPNVSRSNPTSDEQHPSLLNRQHEGENVCPNGSASKSPSSSCSQSSSSSQCCSSGTQPSPCTLHAAAAPETVREESVNGVVKRVKSDAELLVSNDGLTTTLPRSQSHASLSEHPKSECLPPTKDGPRVKVTFGEEKIRFRLQNHWGYQDLVKEIARRFGIDDPRGFQLKYLDDDLEWVLLTCDADLEECIDVCRASQTQTIRLAFLCNSQHQFGSSLGTKNPSGISMVFS
nr:protein NLP5-like [Ipomoea batatas]